jgi:drug/metabolite transporter (DMT)-like permease
LKPNSLFAVATRSFFGASSMIMYFGALSFIPIAEAGAGLFTAPIFVLIISSLYFKVRVGVWRILAVSIGFLGVLFVLKPDVGELSYFSFLPLLAGFFYALLGLTTRYLCPNESTEVLTFGFFAALGIYGLLGLLYFTIFPAIGETSFLTKGFVWPNAKFNLIIISQALVSVVGVALITRSYQVAEASYVSVFEYTFLLSAGFWGYMLFGEMLDLTAILGVTFIVLAGIIILFRGT